MKNGANFTFFEKYTTVMWNGNAYTFYSDPFEVVPYNELSVEVLAAGLTASASFGATIEESNDLETWTAIAASGPVSTPGTMTTLTASRPQRFVRLVVEFIESTTVPAYLVFWAKGVTRNAL